MTYSFRPGMVEENEDFLDYLLAAAQTKAGIPLEVEAGFKLWKVHQLLQACDVYPSECGGRFVGLRNRVRVKFKVVDGVSTLIAVPKNEPMLMRTRKDPILSLKSMEPTSEEEKAALDEIVAELRAAEAAAKPRSVWDLLPPSELPPPPGTARDSDPDAA